jgi:hypothetical protein
MQGSLLVTLRSVNNVIFYVNQHSYGCVQNSWAIQILSHWDPVKYVGHSPTNVLKLVLEVKRRFDRELFVFCFLHCTRVIPNNFLEWLEAISFPQINPKLTALDEGNICTNLLSFMGGKTLSFWCSSLHPSQWPWEFNLPASQVTHTFSQQKDDFFSQQNRRAEDKTLCPEGRGLVDANGQLVLVTGPIFWIFWWPVFSSLRNPPKKWSFCSWKIFGKSLEDTGISSDNP